LHERSSGCRVTQHQRGFDAHDAIAKPTQLLVPSAVSRAAATMHATVHLHHQTDCRREEVRN
jgi:hypothetical protein